MGVQVLPPERKTGLVYNPVLSAPSSRGLGRRPLKAVTPVQIWSGLPAGIPCSERVSARSAGEPWWLLGRVWAAYRCGDRVETGGGLVVEAVHEVAVAVDGDLDRGVAEPSLDRLWVFAFGDEPGGVGVTQVMDPARRTDRFCDGSAPDPSEGSPAEKPASFGGPDRGVGWGMGVEMMAESVDDDLREGDGALGGCGLRGSEEGWLSGGFDERCPDGEPPPVNVWPRRRQVHRTHGTRVAVFPRFPSRFGWWPNATDHITWERLQGQASTMLMSSGSDSRPLPSGAGDLAG